eukprot:CAMPEP_0206002512 /NCGR_PEP_ID=MMETSP1464-20131121/2795_1 /ASSEMBLY_ACC=CAM_ASM_001124 /TAXON_ID=119497 /ORGANISM="Exanthemachrysis gayraliae, Strain RCC1523" /LENGTH=301 /DNA_ID=CAMNT_0053375857 /DNA_START=217 /DNA_END=1118 /DNA_ORIENTATION=+
MPMAVRGPWSVVPPSQDWGTDQSVPHAAVRLTGPARGGDRVPERLLRGLHEEHEWVAAGTASPAPTTVATGVARDHPPRGGGAQGTHCTAVRTPRSALRASEAHAGEAHAGHGRAPNLAAQVVLRTKSSALRISEAHAGEARAGHGRAPKQRPTGRAHGAQVQALDEEVPVSVPRGRKPVIHEGEGHGGLGRGHQGRVPGHEGVHDRRHVRAHKRQRADARGARHERAPRDAGADGGNGGDGEFVNGQVGRDGAPGGVHALRVGGRGGEEAGGLAREERGAEGAEPGGQAGEHGGLHDASG